MDLIKNTSWYKFLFKLICLSFLIYQSIDLLNDFSMGKTVISLEVKRLEEEPIPAVTLCSQNWLSIERLSNYSHNNKENISYYREVYQTLYEEYEQVLNQGDPISTNENKSRIMEKINKVYKIIKGLVEFSGLTPFQMMSNYSVKLTDKDNIYWYIGIFKGARIDKRLFPNEEEPIESFIPIPLNFHKCFTYYSHLKNMWTQFQFKLSYSILRAKYEYNNLPGWQMRPGDLSLSIHSPNSIPNYPALLQIDPKKAHDFYYSQVNTELLGEGYDTNCFNYDLDYKYANFNLRSDCLSSCIEDTVEKYPVFNGQKLSCRTTNYPLRYEMFKMNEHINICYPNNSIYYASLPMAMKKLITSLEYNCTQKCRMDCNYRYYILEHKEMEIKNYKNYLGTLITIRHGNLPDILIKYLPQTTFLSFICNFGGLLGMWLGLSILAICQDSSNILIKIIQKRKINWKNIKNIFNFKLNFSPRINIINIIAPSIFFNDMPRIQ